jgi:hypothetical protein
MRVVGRRIVKNRRVLDRGIVCTFMKLVKKGLEEKGENF